MLTARILPLLFLLSLPPLLNTAQFKVDLATNILYAGERTRLVISVRDSTNGLINDYTGYVHFSSDDPALKVNGRDPTDGSWVALPNSGDIILKNGSSSNTFYIQPHSPGFFHLTVTEPVQNHSSPVSAGTTSFTVVPASGTLKFSEILSDADTGGYQYLEICNTSPSPVNLSNMSIFKYYKYSTGGQNSTYRSNIVSHNAPRILQPGGYLLVTYDKSILDDVFTDIASLPGPVTNLLSRKLDTSGHLLVYLNGTLCDAMAYSSDQTPAYISLERISFQAGSFDTANWTASLTGAKSNPLFYGTPGRRNGTDAGSNAKSVVLSIKPGLKTVEKTAGMVPITYSADTPGRISLFILDSSGNIVRRLLNETDIAANIEYNAGFDLKNGSGKPLPTGFYFALIRFINEKTGASAEKAGSLIIR